MLRSWAATFGSWLPLAHQRRIHVDADVFDQKTDKEAQSYGSTQPKGQSSSLKPWAHSESAPERLE